MFKTKILFEKPDASLGSNVYSLEITTRKQAKVALKQEPNGNAAKWADCVVRIRDHSDRDAFAQVFSYFAPRVKAFLLKSGATDEMAEECAQEALVTLWQKAHLYDPSRASVSTWIFTIARNKRIDMLRKAKRPEPEELAWGETHEPDASDIIALQQETSRLAKAVTELPKKQREVVVKAFYGDLSHQEIAEVTGLPLGTIKSRIRLALERLRHTMK